MQASKIKHTAWIECKLLRICIARPIVDLLVGRGHAEHELRRAVGHGGLFRGVRVHEHLRRNLRKKERTVRILEKRKLYAGARVKHTIRSDILQ